MFEKKTKKDDEVKTDPDSPAAIEAAAGKESRAQAIVLPNPDAEKLVKVKMSKLFILNGRSMEVGQVVEVPASLLLAGNFATCCEVVKDAPKPVVKVGKKH